MSRPESGKESGEQGPERSLTEIAQEMLTLPAWDRAIGCISSDMHATIISRNPPGLLIRRIAEDSAQPEATDRSIGQGVLEDFEETVVMTALPEMFILLTSIYEVQLDEIRDVLVKGIDIRLESEKARVAEVKPSAETNELLKWSPEYYILDQRLGRIGKLAKLKRELQPPQRPASGK